MASLLKSIERVVVGKLTTHPSNARQGDIGAISESLEANAQYAPLIVQRSTGHILAGNHTYKAAVALGWKEIDVAYVDVDDDKALRVLLSANRTADLAAYDNAALTELLQELAATPQGFTGTGYDGDALDELLKDLAGDPLDPSPQLDKLEYRIVVDCWSEEHQRELIERFEADGLTVKALTS